jgi:hypothetical protein
MRYWLWVFILAVAVADASFTWRCRESVAEWESNPVATWVFRWGGALGAIAYRGLWLAFAAAIARVKSRLSWLVTPVWAAGHLYLLVILLQTVPYAPVLASRIP